MIALMSRALESTASTPTPNSTNPTSTLSTTASAASSTSTNDSSPATQVLTKVNMSQSHQVLPGLITSIKDVLQWLFLVLVVVVVGSVIQRRIYSLKRRGLPINSFFSARHNLYNPRPTRPFPTRFGRTLSVDELANVPTAYTHRTQSVHTQVMDDEVSRGLNQNELGDQKDGLPAYNKLDSPPIYADTLPVLPYDKLVLRESA
ncbi:hypothetical protein F5878DRAFT_299400 [Lentinula raphanica]|uniref:Uncharacterized protein n=1 Tax=Lentinula raphanica TaxID=153919 RepID=A0AA38P3J2_9AGAR|nr:hypothetical protein F5878DRAFT_299400 [Lentinula raphanica]